MKLNLFQAFIVILCFGAIVGCSEKNKSKNLNTCISNPSPTFSEFIVNPNDVLVVIPPGLLTGGEPKGHSYIRMNLSSSGSPIYAPADMTLKSILYYDSYVHHGGQTYKVYKLEFDVSCEVSVWLDHVYLPVSKITSAGSSTPAPNTSSEYEAIVNISFNAGELIGYPQPFEFDVSKSQVDFGVMNTTANNFFINTSKFPNKVKNSVCPYNFFPSGIKSQFEALYGDENPVVGGVCRSVAIDISNSISGYWFNASGNGSGQGLFVGYLAIGLNVDENQFQIGGLSNGAFMGSLGASPKPEDVSINQEVCYTNGTDSHVYFRLNTSTSLDVAFKNDNHVCPGSFPASAGYTIYENYVR